MCRHCSRPSLSTPLSTTEKKERKNLVPGAQDAVSQGSPLLSVLGFLILPIVWSVPEALVTAELATTFPENSGYVAWVTAAFGPFWGFQEGFWHWISGVTDNAVYPVMLLSYIQEMVPILKDGWARTCDRGRGALGRGGMGLHGAGRAWRGVACRMHARAITWATGGGVSPPFTSHSSLPTTSVPASLGASSSASTWA